MKALLLVDIQNDFMPGGALAVPDADQILPQVQRLLEMPFEIRIATKDWHPKGHGSFAPTHLRQPGDRIKLDGIEQLLWPIHCVQDTPGAMFSPGWDVSHIDQVILKGIDSRIDSYSAFFDNAHRRDTGLGQYLLSHGVDKVYIAGLATDYCVLYSSLDALTLGFDTYVVTDACKGINVQPGDVDKALAKIVQHGGHLTTTDQLHAMCTENH